MMRIALILSQMGLAYIKGCKGEGKILQKKLNY